MPISARSALDQTDAKGRARETILVVDNEPSIREVIAVILRRADYSVLLAADDCQAVSGDEYTERCYG
jgi:DNA-binding NtrC family response regulator